MQKTITFTVKGKVHGKGRPRFARMGKFTKTYTPKDTASYENFIKVLFLEELKESKVPMGCKVRVQITSLFKLPKSTSKKKALRIMDGGCERYCDKKPDIDNIVKIICDALNGVAYDDDKQVVSVSCKKLWTTGDEESVITITYMD